MKKMRDLMEAVMVLNENEGGYPPAIERACAAIDAAGAAMLEAINEFYYEKAKALSTQWPGCYVLLSGGNGSESISIVPTVEVVQKALSDEDYYEELLSRARAVLANDVFFEMLVDLSSTYDNSLASLTCGLVAFKDDQEVSYDELVQYQKTLPGHQKRIGQYGFETF